MGIRETMNLIIVESPTKAKTISKFLTKDYKIESSFGHVRDLPEKELGVDIKNDFEPKYVIPQKAKPKVKILKESVKKAKATILATDEDREGESIAWHLAYVLGLKNPQRIVFHEITKPAIEEALKNPRSLDLKLIDAQQARRVLDRLVGYKLSPFLWKKLMRGLSAGRVQSVAVKLICDRENEINKFVPQEYWSIVASLLKLKTENEKLKNNEFLANLFAKDGKAIDKLEIKNENEAKKILTDLDGAEYKVASVEKKEAKRNPLPPFTTSTLQQTASAKLAYGAQRTMSIAQKLYEKGHITYHRTDSVNLSSMSQQVAKKFIEDNFGKNYRPGYARIFKTKSKSAQEAHEAIRPTFPSNTPEQLKAAEKLMPDEFKLYNLIWRRFMASQMKEATFDATTIDIQANPLKSSGQYTFRANGQIMKFDGFLKVYPMKFEEADLPALTKNEILELKEITPFQHFTQPPARYSEATLIKALEKAGIGRPSTNAPILSTIQPRNYVEKDENKKLKPTKTGLMVNELLVEHFPEIVDIGFTAEMEEKLDKIAEGKQKWIDTIKTFYTPFEKNLKEKEQSVVKKDLTEKTDKICPDCNSPMVIRLGRFGRFYACSKFPNCKHTEPLPRPSLNIECPKCGQGQIVEKKSKRGKIFYGCANWPHCDFALWDKPTGEKCRKCGSLMVTTKSKKIKCSDAKCKSVI